MDPSSIIPPSYRDDELRESLESDLTVIGSKSSITPHIYPPGLTSRELAHALRGEMLGHFLLQQYIGGGGMGVVFKALDTTLDRIVAVKVVASHRMDNDDLQRRFLIEAQSTARLDHPNIARVHYIGRDRGLPYIVFEYIDGVNVRDLTLERGPLPVGESLSYAFQIAHALAHAWQRDVVHRDIKPSNILVTGDGQAKLVDMGLARLRQIGEEEEELTATGITLGTFDYISPEQARDPRLADARSDIYSLGCTLFYMLVGRAPFAQGTALQKLLQHQNERPPDVRSFRSDVPDSASRLLRRMLAKDPLDRQQNPLELVGELTAILEELEVSLPSPAAPLAWTLAPRSTPRWRRHAAWLAPIALLLGAALIADAYSRDSSTVAVFPELRHAPLEGAGGTTTDGAIEAAEQSSTTAESPAATASAAAAPQPQTELPSTPATLQYSTGPLSMGPALNSNTSLWDFVADGESTSTSASALPLMNSVVPDPGIPATDFEELPIVVPPPVDLPIESAISPHSTRGPYGSPLTQ